MTFHNFLLGFSFSLLIIPITGIFFIIKTEIQMKPIYKNDRKPGKIYKAYVHCNSGKIVFWPERISEDYAKNTWGLRRHPSLDYTVC